MKRFYVFKDGQQIGSAGNRENALDMVRTYQAQEDHQFLKAEFSIIEGEEEFIPYEQNSGNEVPAKKKTSKQKFLICSGTMAEHSFKPVEGHVKQVCGVWFGWYNTGGSWNVTELTSGMTCGSVPTVKEAKEKLVDFSQTVLRCFGADERIQQIQKECLEAWQEMNVNPGLFNKMWEDGRNWTVPNRNTETA